MPDQFTIRVRAIKPNCYTTAEAAALVGKSHDTLRRWRRDGRCVPSDSLRLGETTMWLYTQDDIKVLKQLARTVRPGRKPKGENDA